MIDEFKASGMVQIVECWCEMREWCCGMERLVCFVGVESWKGSFWMTRKMAELARGFNGCEK